MAGEETQAQKAARLAAFLDKPPMPECGDGLTFETRYERFGAFELDDGVHVYRDEVTVWGCKSCGATITEPPSLTSGGPEDRYRKIHERVHG
jgi:hypothetical protein